MRRIILAALVVAVPAVALIIAAHSISSAIASISVGFLIGLGLSTAYDHITSPSSTEGRIFNFVGYLWCYGAIALSITGLTRNIDPLAFTVMGYYVIGLTVFSVIAGIIGVWVIYIKD